MGMPRDPSLTDPKKAAKAAELSKGELHASKVDELRLLTLGLRELHLFKETELQAIIADPGASQILRRKFANSFLKKSFDFEGMPESNLKEIQRLFLGVARKLGKHAYQAIAKPTFVIAGGDAFLNWLLLPAYPKFREFVVAHRKMPAGASSARVKEGASFPLMSIRREKAADLLNNGVIDFALLRSPVKKEESQKSSAKASPEGMDKQASKRAAKNEARKPLNDLGAHVIHIEDLVREVENKSESKWNWSEWLMAKMREAYPEEEAERAVKKASQMNDTIAIELGVYHYFIGTDGAVYAAATSAANGAAIGTKLPIAARLNHIAHSHNANGDFESARIDDMLASCPCFPNPKVAIECENFAQALTSARFGGCAAVLPSLVFGLPGITEALRCVCQLPAGANQRVSLVAKVSWLNNDEDAMWIFYYLSKAMKEVADNSLGHYAQHLQKHNFPAVL